MNEFEIEDHAELLTRIEETKEVIKLIEKRKQTQKIKERLEENKCHLQKLEKILELFQMTKVSKESDITDSYEELKNKMKEFEIEDHAELLTRIEETKEEIKLIEKRKQTQKIKERLEENKCHLQKLEELLELFQMTHVSKESVTDSSEELKNKLKEFEIEDHAELLT